MEKDGQPLWEGVLTDRQPAAPRGRNARGPKVAMRRVSPDVSPQGKKLNVPYFVACTLNDKYLQSCGPSSR